MTQVHHSQVLRTGTGPLSSADQRILFLRKRECVLEGSVITHDLFSSFEECDSQSSHKVSPSTPQEIIPNLNGLEFMPFPRGLNRAIREKMGQ